MFLFINNIVVTYIFHIIKNKFVVMLVAVLSWSIESTLRTFLVSYSSDSGHRSNQDVTDRLKSISSRFTITWKQRCLLPLLYICFSATDLPNKLVVQRKFNFCFHSHYEFLVAQLILGNQIFKSLIINRIAIVVNNLKLKRKLNVSIKLNNLNLRFLFRIGASWN